MVKFSFNGRSYFAMRDNTGDWATLKRPKAAGGRSIQKQCVRTLPFAHRHEILSMTEMIVCTSPGTITRPVLMRLVLLTAAVLAAPGTLPAQESSLSVERIMQDYKKWVGAWPSNPVWSEDGDTLFFEWNPMGTFPVDSVYRVPRNGGEPVLLTQEERRNPGPRFDGWHHGEHVYDAEFERKVYERDGDLFLYSLDSREQVRLTQTRDAETSPRFSPDGRAILYTRDNNLYRLDLATSGIRQLTDLRPGEAPTETEPDTQDAYLKAQQEYLFEVIRDRKEKKEARKEAEKRDSVASDIPPTIYFGDRLLQQLKIDPTERFVSFVTSKEPDDSKQTKAIDYVTETGYAEELLARAKVGVPADSAELHIQDLERDTTYVIDLHQLPGAYDVPAYLAEQGVEVDSSTSKRSLYSFGPGWSADGRFAVLDVFARDYKDRWLARLDPESGELTVLDRQHDDAWVAGPGIWWTFSPVEGWLPDNRTYYFQSEATGYSHLYTVDVETGEIAQLTDGEFEVFNPSLSRDGETWTFASSAVSPFVRHFYRMPVRGGTPEQLTSMDGKNDVALNPRGDLMAVLHSFTTRPPDVFLQKPGDKPKRITHSQTEDFLAYEWRVPKTVRFEASDGAMVPAHVFEPEHSNGAAVLFVHGSGYMQNVHHWWSSYFREYMFNNLLTDLGYTVMQVDYRASAGYGRDWRTAIYRHMGGRDLQDYVDAEIYLDETFGIGPDRTAIYGGSYGGFMTLMALFTEPEHFGAGAALRSVTDWAHYNHFYASAILNTPATDSLAYARSSPINFADGLEDPLLMPHGLVDLNVQFQDIIRLSQRLVELGKEDWELAVYPVEGHGFKEPSSWTDEYRRILKLIEETVGPNRVPRVE
jgi:dipeptidyl aminopeptidase/acylaminoacyl peptidase